MLTDRDSDSVLFALIHLEWCVRRGKIKRGPFCMNKRDRFHCKGCRYPCLLGFFVTYRHIDHNILNRLPI